MFNNYKFLGHDRVSVRAHDRVKAFDGYIVACIADLPVMGKIYMVMAYDISDAGIDSSVYPFPAIGVPEQYLTKLD